MKLSDLLDIRVIAVNLRARDKKAALEEMAGILKKAGTDRRFAGSCKALLDREAAGSTALGRGIAFPHARLDRLREPVALLALSQRGH